MVCDYLDVIYIGLGCQHTNLSNLAFLLEELLKKMTKLLAYFMKFIHTVRINYVINDKC